MPSSPLGKRLTGGRRGLSDGQVSIAGFGRDLRDLDEGAVLIMAWHRPVRRASSLLLLAAAMLGRAAVAQAQDVPGSIPNRDQVELPVPDPQREPAVASVDSRAALQAQTCPFATSALRVRIDRLRFIRPDGGAPQPEIVGALQRVTAPGEERSIVVVCTIRDRANQALRDAGYVASVQIPPQSIEGGDLQLQVVTARIVEVRVRGEPGPYRDLLSARVAQLKRLDPLREDDAERLLLLSGDVPGLEVRLGLSPAGTAPGEVIGDLSVSYQRAAAFGNVQNYNSRQTGRETGYARLEVYGLTGLSDVTYVGASTTADFREQYIAQAGHSFGIGRGGASISARGTYAWSRPDLGPLDLRTRSLIAGVEASLPVVRAVDRNLSVATGFDFIEQRTYIGPPSQGGLLNRDKTRTVFARLSGDVGEQRFDGQVLSALSGFIEVRKGLDILGATKAFGFDGGAVLPSRIEGRADAFVVRGDVDGVFGIGSIFSIAGQARGQWTSDPLLNLDEFSVGNLSIGRGYDPGANSGDRAIAGRAELRAQVPVTRRVGTELFGFYDHVRIENLDTNSTEGKRTLRSAGGGLRVTLPGIARLEVMYAKALDRALSNDDAPPSGRVLVSLTARFLPSGFFD